MLGVPPTPFALQTLSLKRIVRKLIFQESMMARACAVLLFLSVYLMHPLELCAQSGPTGGGNEVQVWTGGGHGLNGSTSGTGVWNLGFRYGWVLTDPLGPGALRGRFEYAIDVLPAFVLTQRTNTAYGIGLNPFALKWNFGDDRKTVPYAELGGGVLFTNTDVPEGT